MLTATTFLTLLWSERSNKWVVPDSAEITTTCDSYSSTTSCNSRHNHTAKYTDSASGKVIFTDKTYTVKHNGKAPTVKHPVPKGYRFVVDLPRSGSMLMCVTYVTQWASDDAPALTIEHVACLKGYGKAMSVLRAGSPALK